MITYKMPEFHDGLYLAAVRKFIRAEREGNHNLGFQHIMFTCSKGQFDEIKECPHAENISETECQIEIYHFKIAESAEDK